MTRSIPSHSRREFVRGVLRGSLLMALAGTAGWALRGRTIVWSAAPCREAGSCSACQLYAGCRLFPAELARERRM